MINSRIDKRNSRLDRRKTRPAAPAVSCPVAPHTGAAAALPSGASHIPRDRYRVTHLGIGTQSHT